MKGRRGGAPGTEYAKRGETEYAKRGHPGRKARARRAHAKERKWPLLGAARLVKQHSWAEPASPRKWEPGPIPSFRVIDDPELDAHCRMEVLGFRGQYAEAREARLRGENVVWPAGTYLMKVQHGAEVAAPDRESVLAADDVYEELPARLGAEECRAISERLRELCVRVDPEQQEDALGARIDAGAENAVTRRESRRVETGGEETPARLVTLRGNLRVREPETVGEPPDVQTGEDTSVAPRDERDDDEPPDQTGDK